MKAGNVGYKPEQTDRQPHTTRMQLAVRTYVRTYGVGESGTMQQEMTVGAGEMGRLTRRSDDDATRLV